MQLNDAVKLCRQTMNEFGLGSMELKLNGRLKRVLGRYRWHYGRTWIEMSTGFIKANSEADVYGVIVHEIAHALCGPREGHSNRWRKMARFCGIVSPNRISHEVNISYNWLTKCPKCDRVFKGGFHRKPKVKYQCNKCSTLIELIDNRGRY